MNHAGTQRMRSPSDEKLKYWSSSILFVEFHSKVIRGHIAVDTQEVIPIFCNINTTYPISLNRKLCGYFSFFQFRKFDNAVVY